MLMGWQTSGGPANTGEASIANAASTVSDIFAELEICRFICVSLQGGHSFLHLERRALE
jgi:hypothetical protein